VYSKCSGTDFSKKPFRIEKVVQRVWLGKKNDALIEYLLFVDYDTLCQVALTAPEDRKIYLLIHLPTRGSRVSIEAANDEFAEEDYLQRIYPGSKVVMPDLATSSRASEKDNRYAVSSIFAFPFFIPTNEQMRLRRELVPKINGQRSPNSFLYSCTYPEPSSNYNEMVDDLRHALQPSALEELHQNTQRELSQNMNRELERKDEELKKLLKELPLDVPEKPKAKKEFVERFHHFFLLRFVIHVTNVLESLPGVFIFGWKERCALDIHLYNPLAIGDDVDARILGLLYNDPTNVFGKVFSFHLYAEIPEEYIVDSVDPDPDFSQVREGTFPLHPEEYVFENEEKYQESDTYYEVGWWTRGEKLYTRPSPEIRPIWSKLSFRINLQKEKLTDIFLAMTPLICGIGIGILSFTLWLGIEWSAPIMQLSILVWIIFAFAITSIGASVIYFLRSRIG
jgi:hypothetical protein